jgi:hypothetical protein
MTAIRRFFRLPRARRRLLISAAVLQIAARVALAVIGPRRAVQSLPVWGVPIARWTRSACADVCGIRWAAAAAAARLGGTCFTQALAARALCLAAGRPSRLVVGARLHAGAARRPEFHAWLEAEGASVPATPAAAFTTLTSWS